MKHIWAQSNYSLSKFPLLLKLGSLGEITPNVLVDKEVGYYKIKTITTKRELKDVLELRFNVFYREFSEPKIDPPYAALDIDAHDFLCDHLIVKDQRNDQIVACYRLLASQFKPKTKKFYSESEFILDEFLRGPENKLELGRACVHKDFRRGTVILLLWRGLIDYALKCRTRYLFGCSSINRSQFAHVPSILAGISEEQAYISEWDIGIRPKYKFDFEMLNSSLDEKPKPINSLMQMYINAGAKVSQSMAYDREMNCLDLLTILDMEKLPVVYKKGS
jgi:putative hemolysin